MPLHIWNDILSFSYCSCDILIEFACYTVKFFAKSIENKIAKVWSIWQSNKGIALKHVLFQYAGLTIILLSIFQCFDKLENIKQWLANFIRIS